MIIYGFSLIVIFQHAVAAVVPVAAVCIFVDSEGETAAVDEGGESATVYWLTVGASKPEGIICPAGSHIP